MHRLVFALILLLAAPLVAAPQLPGLGGVFKKKPKEQEQKKEEEKKKEEPGKPLFADDSGAQAKQKKDTTAMGFSGLNPDGTVEQAVLNSSPTAEDEARAAALAGTRVDPQELEAFLKEGNLNAKGGR